MLQRLDRADARSSTRPAGRCSTSGRTSDATPRAATRRLFTARSGTRKRRRPRRRPSPPAAGISSCSTRAKRSASATSSRSGGPDQRAAFLERFGERGLARVRSRTATFGGSGSPTRRRCSCRSRSRSARCCERRCWLDTAPTRLETALSGVRHDLQRHAGSPGCRGRAAERTAGRPDDRHRRATTAATPAIWPASAPPRSRRSTSRTRTASCRRTRSAIDQSGQKTEVTSNDWLPAAGAVTIGLTSGASTPDNLVGAAIDQAFSLYADRRRGAKQNTPLRRICHRYADFT